MSTHKFIILSNPAHPLFEKLKALDVTLFYNIERDDPLDDKRLAYSDENRVLFDFTLLNTSKKKKLLKNLNIHFNAPFVSDLSNQYVHYFLKNVKNLRGALSSVFYSPTNTYEYYATDSEMDQAILEMYQLLEIGGIRIKTKSLGFHYPRVIATIINEAYFALGEDLASKQDIDNAMKYGVNYPMGPFEFCERIGAEHVVNLLNELHFITKDPRYKIAPHLLLESNYP